MTDVNKKKILVDPQFVPVVRDCAPQHQLSLRTSKLVCDDLEMGLRQFTVDGKQQEKELELINHRRGNYRQRARLPEIAGSTVTATKEPTCLNGRVLT